MEVNFCYVVYHTSMIYYVAMLVLLYGLWTVWFVGEQRQLLVGQRANISCSPCHSGSGPGWWFISVLPLVVDHTYLCRLRPINLSFGIFTVYVLLYSICTAKVVILTDCKMFVCTVVLHTVIAIWFFIMHTDSYCLT